MEQQTYHPDNISAPNSKPRPQRFNNSLACRWCWELSKYHPSASRHVKTSWEAFLVELGTLANGYILREVTPDLTQDIVWEQATEKKLKDHLFPKLTAEQYTEKSLEESELSLLKSLLNFMLSEIGPAIIQHPLLEKHPINLVTHQVIHDLFRLFPEERYGNWQVIEAPIMKLMIKTASSPAFGTLEAFPTDILRKIFHNTPDDLHTGLPTALRLRRVCKSWKDHVVPRLCVSWTLRDSKNAINKAQLIINLFPNLAKVNLILVRDPVTTHALVKTLEAMPLTTLSLYDVDEQLVDEISRCYALRQLHFVAPVSIKEFQSICLVVPSFLEELTITLTAEITSLPISIQRLTVLQTLFIGQPSTRSKWLPPTEKFSLIGLETLSKLNTLQVYIPDAIFKRENLIMSLTSLAHLEHLLLSNCSLNDLILIGSQGGLGKLTSLTICDDYESHNEEDDNDDDESSRATPIKLFPTLKSLSFEHSQSQTTRELASVLLRYSFQNLQELRLTGCVVDDALFGALQQLSCLNSLEMCGCTRKQENSYKEFTWPIRKLCIDSDSAFGITFMCCVNYPQLEHLTIVGDMGCSGWHCEWYGALRGCDKNRLKTINATECVICQLAVSELPKYYPNTMVLYPPTDCILTCNKEDHVQD